MKKLFMVLYVMIMLFGIVGCPRTDNSPNTFNQESYSIPVGSSVNTGGDIGGSGASPVPEPGTLVLLGSGLVGLLAFGRKKLKK